MRCVCFTSDFVLVLINSQVIEMFMNIMNPMDMEELLSYTPDQLNKVALRQFNRRELLRGLEKERNRI